jgi:hypothetical protein
MTEEIDEHFHIGARGTSEQLDRVGTSCACHEAMGDDPDPNFIVCGMLVCWTYGTQSRRSPTMASCQMC